MSEERRANPNPLDIASKIRAAERMVAHPIRLTTTQPLKEVRIMAIYSLRSCRFCGKEYQPKTSRMAHCSARCRFMWIAAPFDQVGGCWEWPKSKAVQTGYGQFMVCANPMKLETAHRYSYETFVDPVPGGMMVLHKCDNKACFNPKHLWIGTNLDNMRDMVAKRRHMSHKTPELHSAMLRAGWVKRRATHNAE